MGVRLRSAVSPVTPAIIGSRRPRHRIGLKAPPVRFQPAATSNACAGRMWMAPWSHLHGMRTTHSRPLHTCSRGRAGTRAGARVALGSDDRDSQLWRDRPRASPPPGSGSRIRQRRPPEPADRPICAIPTTGGGDTSRRTSPQSASPPREERRRLGSRLPDLVPTYARPGPRPLRRRSTWLLLSPKSGHASRAIEVVAIGAERSRQRLYAGRPGC